MPRPRAQNATDHCSSGTSGNLPPMQAATDGSVASDLRRCEDVSLRGQLVLEPRIETPRALAWMEAEESTGKRRRIELVRQITVDELARDPASIELLGALTMLRLRYIPRVDATFRDGEAPPLRWTSPLCSFSL